MKPPRQTKLVWLVGLVLALGFMINYIDRGNLSVAAPLLQGEFDLNPTHLGFLFSSFFVSYALMQIPAGLLVDRLNLKWVYAAAFVVWSLSNAAVAFAGSFLSIVVLRILLSVGESVSLPASSKVFATLFREDQRGVANGILDSGIKVGPAVGVMLGGLFMARYGWRPWFLITGLGGLLWLIPWFSVARIMKADAGRQFAMCSEATGPEATGVTLTLRQILSSPRAWATFVGSFCGGYVWYLMLTWLPAYLVMERQMPLSEMGIYGSLLFLTTAITSVATGFATDQMIRRGWSASKVRIRFAAAGLLLSALLVPAGLAPTPGGALLFLLLTFAFFGFYSASVWAISQSIAGPRNIGRWAGIQNFVGSLGGVASPALTGWVVTATGSFQGAFVVTAAVVVFGALIYLFAVKTLDPIPAS